VAVNFLQQLLYNFIHLLQILTDFDNFWTTLTRKEFCTWPHAQYQSYHYLCVCKHDTMQNQKTTLFHISMLEFSSYKH